MNKSVIVYGPQGCGKTRYAERIAKHFGLGSIVDDFDPRQSVQVVGTLYLTNDMRTPDHFGGGARRVLSFDEVARQINWFTPRTPWFDHLDQPSKLGFYEVRLRRSSIVPQPKGNSWWDGEFFRYGTQYGRQFYLELGDAWRGLAEEPLPVKGGA